MSRVNVCAGGASARSAVGRTTRFTTPSWRAARRRSTAARATSSRPQARESTRRDGREAPHRRRSTSRRRRLARARGSGHGRCPCRGCRRPTRRTRAAGHVTTTMTSSRWRRWRQRAASTCWRAVPVPTTECWTSSARRRCRAARRPAVTPPTASSRAPAAHLSAAPAAPGRSRTAARARLRSRSTPRGSCSSTVTEPPWSGAAAAGTSAVSPTGHVAASRHPAAAGRTTSSSTWRQGCRPGTGPGRASDRRRRGAWCAPSNSNSSCSSMLRCRVASPPARLRHRAASDSKRVIFNHYT